MPVTFHLPDYYVTGQIQELLKEWNPKIHKAGGKIAALFCDNTDGEPALKAGGYPCAAIISIVPLVQRMFVAHDALLRIDSRAWSELSERGQEALLVHEILHLELQPKPDSWTPSGADDPWWKTDDLGRPVIKCVPADWNGGDGFAAVVATYGRECVEIKNLTYINAITDRALRGELPDPAPNRD